MDLIAVALEFLQWTVSALFLGGGAWKGLEALSLALQRRAEANENSERLKLEAKRLDHQTRSENTQQALNAQDKALGNLTTQLDELRKDQVEDRKTIRGLEQERNGYMANCDERIEAQAKEIERLKGLIRRLIEQIRHNGIKPIVDTGELDPGKAGKE